MFNTNLCMMDRERRGISVSEGKLFLQQPHVVVKQQLAEVHSTNPMRALRGWNGDRVFSPAALQSTRHLLHNPDLLTVGPPSSQPQHDAGGLAHWGGSHLPHSAPRSAARARVGEALKRDFILKLDYLMSRINTLNFPKWTQTCPLGPVCVIKCRNWSSGDTFCTQKRVLGPLSEG